MYCYVDYGGKEGINEEEVQRFAFYLPSPFVIVEAIHSFQFQDISKSDCGNLIGSYYPIRYPSGFNSVVDKYSYRLLNQSSSSNPI